MLLQLASFLLLIFLVSKPALAGEVFVLGISNSESFDRSLPSLRYSSDDLTRMQQVLKRMASIPDDHFIIQKEATRETIRSAFASLSKKMGAARAAADSKVILYYNGHSDAKGLHLADGLLAKDELHKLLASLPASTRIAFFDSCYAGALAMKGVKPSEDFIVPRAEFDEPSGSVFFAATSAGNVAFELEELRGSLFTHHVVNGLYGAADGNQDGLVTIDELYQHVYQQMSAQVMPLPGHEKQKPEYSVRLQGRGALVLAQVKRSTAPVLLSPGLKGRLSFSTDGGLQVFTQMKNEGSPLRVLLFPANYKVTVEDGDRIGRAELSVKSQGASLEVGDIAFENAPRLALVAKGERSQSKFALAAGINNSTYARSGPQIEGEFIGKSHRIEDTDLRFLINLGLRQNGLHYRQQRGDSQAISLLLGLRMSIFPEWVWDGQDLRLMLAVGGDDVQQNWNEHPGEDWRTFRRLIPKVAYGLGSSFVTTSGLRWGLFFRREFPFATDAQNGDVLAFGANIYAFSVEW